MMWNTEIILKLIHLYKEKPELWDSQDLYYYNKEKKNEAWINIASELNEEVQNVQVKIKSLLSSFRRERAKMRSHLKTGIEGDYQSKWYAFSSFQFLLNKDNGRETTTDNNTEYGSHDIEQIGLENSDSESTSPEPYYFPLQENQQWKRKAVEVDPLSDTYENKYKVFIKEEISSDLEDNIVDISKENSVTESTLKEQSKQCANQRSHVNQRIDKSNPDISESYNVNVLENVQNMQKDETLTFAQHITTKLRKFDEKRRFMIMHQINNVIFNAEMQMYNNYVQPSHLYQPVHFSYRPTIRPIINNVPQCNLPPPQYLSRF